MINKTKFRYQTDDVAVVFLEESAEKEAYENEMIWPACLPPGKQDLRTGAMSLASGWGSTQPIDGNSGKHIRRKLLYIQSKSVKLNGNLIELTSF